MLGQFHFDNLSILIHDRSDRYVGEQRRFQHRTPNGVGDTSSLRTQHSEQQAEESKHPKLESPQPQQQTAPPQSRERESIQSISLRNDQRGLVRLQRGLPSRP